MAQAGSVDPMQGRCIAVIEDDPRVLSALCAVLNRWGCVAIGGKNSEDIVRNSRDRIPEAILSNLHLGPGHDGPAEISALRRHYGHHIPAALMCEDRAADSREKARSLAFPVIAKPFPDYRLRALLSGLLDHESA